MKTEYKAIKNVCILSVNNSLLNKNQSEHISVLILLFLTGVAVN